MIIKIRKMRKNLNNNKTLATPSFKALTKPVFYRKGLHRFDKKKPCVRLFCYTYLSRDEKI